LRLLNAHLIVRKVTIMRQLSRTEIQAISGAGYSEDIVTAAASIYVGRGIGGAAAGLTTAAFKGAAALVGVAECLAPVATALTTMGAIAAPIMFFAAPAMAFEYAYPGVIEKAVTSYFS
jgi:hypothetical protein